MVVAPWDDQPVVAGLVVQAGAGERVHFGRVKPAKFHAALNRYYLTRNIVIAHVPLVTLSDGRVVPRLQRNI